MGIHYHSSIKDYCSNDPLFKTNFVKFMSENRFQYIMCFLQLSENKMSKEGEKLFKIKSFSDLVQNNCQKYYKKHRDQHR